ncbi:MAG: phosphoribosylglycinamide formyltransferase [Nevskia sp.]|nr:phosphoribosylglycinamide formyltransferase [Nevskia sp.]
MKHPRLVVLISGRGRNLQALIEAQRAGHIPAQFAAVISNRDDAAGLDYARQAGIVAEVLPHARFPGRAAFDAALAQRLRELQPDIVALAGFMRILTDDFVREFEGRLLNIHPSLLPKYPGLDTHRRALEAGDAEHGATVHFVSPALDSGPAVIQGRFSVRPDDDAASLAQRVMEQIELKIYPQAVAWMARGELRLDQGAAVLRGRRLSAPASLADVEEAFR